MKLRIRGNSLRLRLGPADVEAFLRDESIRQTIEFAPDPAGHLTYSLEMSPDSQQLRALHSPGKIRVLLPRPLAMQWAASDAISLDAEQPIAQGRTLKILVEKDFACTDRTRADPDEDAFPNPGT